MARPVGSVTVPETAPEDVFCENRAGEVAANRQIKEQISKTDRLLDIQLPPGWAYAALNISSR